MKLIRIQFDLVGRKSDAIEKNLIFTQLQIYARLGLDFHSFLRIYLLAAVLPLHFVDQLKQMAVTASSGKL